MPEAERWSLGLLYAVFAVVVALLYPLCRWRAGIEPAGRGRRLLRYL
jgi:hypothetical protein